MLQQQQCVIAAHAPHTAYSGITTQVGCCLPLRQVRVSEEKVCLTSDSGCRSSTAARKRAAATTRLSATTPAVLATKDPKERKYAGPRQLLALATAVDPGVRVCGGENSSESCLLSSVRSRSSELLNSDELYDSSSVSSTHTPHIQLTAALSRRSECCECYLPLRHVRVSEGKMCLTSDSGCRSSTAGRK